MSDDGEQHYEDDGGAYDNDHEMITDEDIDYRRWVLQAYLRGDKDITLGDVMDRLLRHDSFQTSDNFACIYSELHVWQQLNLDYDLAVERAFEATAAYMRAAPDCTYQDIDDIMNTLICLSKNYINLKNKKVWFDGMLLLQEAIVQRDLEDSINSVFDLNRSLMYVMSEHIDSHNRTGKEPSWPDLSAQIEFICTKLPHVPSRNNYFKMNSSVVRDPIYTHKLIGFIATKLASLRMHLLGCGQFLPLLLSDLDDRIESLIAHRVAFNDTLAYIECNPVNGTRYIEGLEYVLALDVQIHD